MIDRVQIQTRSFAPGSCEVLEGYGQTEMTAAVGNTPGSPLKPGSMGRPLPGVPVVLVDPLSGEGIWQALLAAARVRGELPPELDERFAWDVLLGRDGTVNAFALPGGFLGLHLGLIGVVTSRDELASVLAHELSHVSQRHIARLLTQQSRQAPWMIASMLLGVLAASKSKNADIGNAAIVGGQADRKSVV